MLKNKYILLGGSAIVASVMVGTNAYLGAFDNVNWSFGSTAAVNQAFTQDLPGKAVFPAIALQKMAKGQEILTALGSRLPEVARYYRMSEEQLRTIIKNDKDIYADEKGRLLYIDSNTVTSANIGGVGSDTSVTSGSIPLEYTFQLHSKPGASKVIYLDFDGHVLEGGKNWWTFRVNNETIVAPPFDIDGDTSTFSVAERQIIQDVWERVAEDYAPFNVNVTTQEPAADKMERTTTSDTFYGTRLLASNIQGVLGKAGSGGSAYLGTFDDIGENAKPPLIFPSNLANSAKYMADAASHEIGHSLGSAHQGLTDGTEYYYGHGDWAPIMGVSYYRNIGHWSKGEYPNANNKVDDIQNFIASGLQQSIDDYGNSISTAGNATVAGNNFTANGYIERSTDVDYFKFNSGAGVVNILASVAPNAPNLDAVLTVYDSAGRVIVTNDAPGLSTSVSTTVTGGTYYVAIKATGAGTLADGYSIHGSMGQYYLSGNIIGTNDNPPVAVISAIPTSGQPPLTVQFSSNGSSDPDGGSVTYLWNFGDSTSSTDPNPSKTYNNAGTFTAVLTVTDTSGLSSSKSVDISAVNLAPVADFTVTTPSNSIPATFTFDASASRDSDGTVDSFTWNYGDGTTGTGVISTHEYTRAGTFAVNLTIADNNGVTATKAVSITTVDPNVLLAPSGVTASGPTGKNRTGGVTLKWIDNSSNETGFYIERATAARSGVPTYTQLALVGANVTTYTDNLSTAGTYYYRLRAVNATTGNISAYSSVAQVKLR